MTDRVSELTTRLRELNIQQAQIIQELETLTNRGTRENHRTNRPDTPDAEGSELSVGDPVQITNQGLFREKNGIITKIGKLVSIRLETGQTTTRKSTNLLKRHVARNDTNDSD